MADFDERLCVLSTYPQPARRRKFGLFSSLFVNRDTSLGLRLPQWAMVDPVSELHHYENHYHSAKPRLVRHRLAYLSRHIQTDSVHLLPRAEGEGSVHPHYDAVVTADDAQIKACLEQQCSKDIKYFYAGHQVIFSVNSGFGQSVSRHKRLYLVRLCLRVWARPSRWNF